MSKLRVAVLGARGRIGSEAVRAVEAAEDMELVAALGRGDELSKLVEADAQVVVELTTPDSVMENLEFCLGHGIHAVVGTTGWTEERLAHLRTRLDAAPGTGVLIAPNFSIGAVLTMKFAQIAAPYFESVEVVELHHPNKVDAPRAPPPAPPSSSPRPGRRQAAPAARRHGHGPGRRPRRSTSTASRCTPCACAGSWPTRRCCSAARARPSPSGTTPCTTPASCRASCSAPVA